MKQEPGDPRVQKTQREPKNENVIKGVVDRIGQRGGEGLAESEGGAEPLGEGTDVGAEEGVEGVGESVVRAETAVG